MAVFAGRVVAADLLVEQAEHERLEELSGAGSWEVNNVYSLGYRIPLPRLRLRHA